MKRNIRPDIKAALLALAACGLFFNSCLTGTEKSRATPLGWRASVTTLAGDGSPGFQDGAAPSARFSDPFGVVAAPDGSVYLTDAGESNRIRKLNPQGEVSTLAGGAEGYADGAGAASSFKTPSALALDRDGNLYVADTGNNRVRKVTPEGVVTTLAGDGTAGFRDGPAGAAQFDAPVGVAVDKDGNVYVADTYNDRVRLVTKDGQVRTLAGLGRPGLADGGAGEALFDTPCALAVSEGGDVYVADTGNNRLRKITKDGQVSTLNVFDPTATVEPAAQNSAGEGSPSASEPQSKGAAPSPTGGATAATPSQAPSGGNADAQASPTAAQPSPYAPLHLSKPAGLALTHDGFLYVTELDRGRVVQIAPDGAARLIAGLGPGFADGEGREAARFNQPAGIALTPDGSLLVADGANYLLRRVAPAEQADAKGAAQDKADGATPTARNASVSHAGEVLPRISVEGFGDTFPWPLDPQGSWHEVAATMGEVRGSYDTDDSRHHLHSGVDVFGVYGQTVRAVREEKIPSPLCNWGFGGLNEGMRAGLMTYVHLRVGRDQQDVMLEGTPFIHVRDDAGKVSRVRVRRGTRLRVGQALGTINRMYHVHMNLGPPGAEVNPLVLPFAGFTDKRPPVIEADGVRLFDESGAPLTEKRAGRLVLRGRVRIVVDAYDQVDGNQPRRRLGLYRLGFQLLHADGAPAPGFERPRVQLEFDRLPPGDDAPKIAYADESGITVYGSKQTRFLYELTNTVRQGRAERGIWDTSELPPGDYTLRVLAADFGGNESDRDVVVTLESGQNHPR